MSTPTLRYAEVAEKAAIRAEEIDRLRSIPADLIAELVATKVLKLWVPAAYGGAQAHVQDVIDAIADTSYHEASIGWSIMIANTTGWTGGHLPVEHAYTVFGSPDAVAGGYAMPAGDAVAVDGGLRVSGRWPWGSGTSHCTAIGGGIRIVDAEGDAASLPDGTRSAFAFFDVGDVEILDTWYAGGLKGTASNDYVVEDALVPEGRWVDLVSTRDRPPVVDETLYRFPFHGAFACAVAAVIAGLARRAVDELIALGDKQPAGSRRGLARRPAVQAELSRADAAVRSAHAFMVDTIGETWAATEAGSADDEHRRLLRLAAVNTARQGAEAVDVCYRAAGGTSVFESSPLQRIFRDTHTVTQHGMVSDRVLEPLGAMRFGLDVDTTQI
jgi:alkylation response protein AidB-like acyl-CoA dehydrogenase